ATAAIGGATPLPLLASGWIVVEGDPGGELILPRRPHWPRHPPRHPPHPIPRPPMWTLELAAEDIAATIENHDAQVEVKARFRNPCARDLEGTYYFPLPAGARIDAFRAVLGGKDLAGEILDRGEAARIYESLVRNTLDPALLEHYGDGMFRARIFPIPASGEAAITVHYRMLVPRENGFYRFEYPLGAEGGGSQRSTSKINVRIAADAELRSVTSPSHPITITRPAKNQATATYTSEVSAKRGTFLIDYLTAGDGIAGGVRAFREAGTPGYFLLRLSPSSEPPPKRPPASVIFVLDTSGSMATGGKIERAKQALHSALARLGAEDTFRLITFAGQVRSHTEGAIAATPENLASAKQFIDSLIARGGTDICAALEHALAAAGGAPEGAAILLLSDGAPTVGVTDIAQIASLITKRAGGDYRLHVFGVGEDVNTVLLDDLARKNRGSRTYLRGDEGMELAITGLLDKLLYPVLTDTKVTATGIQLLGLEPPGSHDLFSGEDLILTGRYEGSGAGTLAVAGNAAGERRTVVFSAHFPSHGGQEEAAFHWARLRIDTLLDELRSAGHPAGDPRRKEIMDLGLRFGIVTPFTSILVREPTGLVAERVGERLREAPRARARLEAEEKGFKESTGADAFGYAKRKAEEHGALAGGRASAPSAEAYDEQALRELEESLCDVRAAGRAFVIIDEHLVDCALDRAQISAPELVLAFGSDDYLAFLRDNPDARELLAAAPALIFAWKGRIVRIDNAAE
ncbi:MAG: VIT and VWA domain-containing protein, partial [Planctomycetes bacterium]|nr:VIT and VWA domain-containing protein [Planctomycetota bacterium]